jgi:hypothetical protein
MLTSSVRIAVSLFLLGGLVVLGEAFWLLTRGRRRLPLRKTLALSLIFAFLGASELIYANRFPAHTLWFYVANLAGISLVLGGGLYAVAMRRSLALLEQDGTRAV